MFQTLTFLDSVIHVCIDRCCRSGVNDYEVSVLHGVTMRSDRCNCATTPVHIVTTAVRLHVKEETNIRRIIKEVTST